MFRTATLIAFFAVSAGALAASPASPRTESKSTAQASTALRMDAQIPQYGFRIASSATTRSAPMVSVPAPGAAALIGLASLVTSRRRAVA